MSEEYGFSYVSLADLAERKMAADDPMQFLEMHGFPLVIDEIQYAPGLFEAIESVVDEEKFKNENNNGMYVITGSQVYELMQGVTQSMAGRVAILRMSSLSQSEIFAVREEPFSGDVRRMIEKSKRFEIDVLMMSEMIIRGGYPELHSNEELRTDEFFSDYVDSYISRDVSQIINLKNREKFYEFLQLTASLTGQELVYSKISKDIGVDVKTVQSWISVLVAGDIIHLLQPYSTRSTVKRIVKRPKLYFWDTGLACYLARVTTSENLFAGYLKGPMVETYIVNEIMKTYRNRRESAWFYYYRDSNMNEIDLMIEHEGLTLVECKSGTVCEKSDVKSFKAMKGSGIVFENAYVICLTGKAYPVDDGVYALPVSSI